MAWQSPVVVTGLVWAAYDFWLKTYTTKGRCRGASRSRSSTGKSGWVRTAFSPPEEITHREHVTGSHDWCADAHGPRVVYVVDERRVPVAFGGEARFGLRGTDKWEVVGDWRAGDDGYRVGWQVLAAELRG